jgi:threonine dehydrogenase-like Zn-dependent dehydrogenase
MKAVQKWGDGKDGMGLRDVPEPKVEPDEVLMEVACVGICGSDLHIWKDEKEHKRPVTLGHEFSGVILDKGRNVGGQWQVGDRIVASNESMAGRIGTTVNGAYAERMTVPERCVHRMPDNTSFEEGALVELVTAMSYSAMYRTPLKPADFVVMCGPGPVGLVMLQIVRLFSPRAIMVTGTKSDDLRLQKAKELGADHIYYSEDDPVRKVQELTNGIGADVVIDASGSEGGLTQATRMVRLGGWITVIGLWGHDIKVNLDCVPYNNLTVRGGWGWAGIDSPDQAVRMALGWHSWERGLQIMAMGKIQLKPIITMRIPLEAWREGFERLEAKKETKVLMYPNEKYLNG